MKIDSSIRFIYKYQNATLEDLLNENKDIVFTGFYKEFGNTKKFIYKLDNVFYLINAKDINEINNAVLKKRNARNSKIMVSGIEHCKMSISDLVYLYKNFGDTILLYDHFINSDTSIIKCNYFDFLIVVREVLNFEKEFKEKKLSSEFDKMQYIYDKYKLECDYWDPIHNYGSISSANKLAMDRNRVISHPYDYIGLIREKYATCQGMAETLVELFRYFKIRSKKISNRIHSMVKVYLTDDNGRKRVSYLDLSREISPHFEDTKYQYFNGIATPRPTSIRKAQKNSYDFFLKQNINIVGDLDQNIAIDLKPKYRIKFVDNNSEILKSTNGRK